VQWANAIPIGFGIDFVRKRTVCTVSCTVSMTFAFTKHPRARWWQVARNHASRVGLLTGALLLQVVLFKLIKYMVLTTGTAQAVSSEDLVTALFLQHTPVPLLLLTLPLLVLVALRMQGALPGLLSIPVYGMAVAMLVGVARAVLPLNLAWCSWEFVALLRDDVLGLLLLGGGFLLALEHSRGWGYRVVLGSFHGLMLGLMVLSGLDFGYFVMTGSVADAYLLRYALTNAQDLSYVFLHELSGGKLAFVILPFLLLALPRLRMRFGGLQGRSASLGPVAALSVILLLVPRAAVPGAVQPLAGNLFVRLLVDLFTRPAWESEAVQQMARSNAPLFDADSLVLAETPRTRPMNVVLVLLESQRSPALYPEGIAASPTPFLDSLARHSMAAAEMYAVVPHTNKALVPILCGFYPRINQGEEPHVPGRCLPAMLGAHGYATAFFSAATLVFENKGAMLRNMGFVEAFGDGHFPVQGFERISYFGYEDRIVQQSLLEWVDRQVAASTPFLLTWLTLAPHHPYKLPRTVTPYPFVEGGRDLNHYLNALNYVDTQVETLYRAFAARGLLEETLFVFVGDHGEAFGEHGRRYHSAVVWDEGLRVPLVLHHPGLTPQVITGVRQQLDLVPTVADLLGYRLEGGTLPGQTLLQPVPLDRKLYHAAWIENQSMAYREGHRKYLYHFRSQPIEVYDTARDPYERHNLAATLSPAQHQQIELELLLWRQRVNRMYE
jgi:phosphoglycerol transferase MdoB-like AlkP superfamily enzyme